MAGAAEWAPDATSPPLPCRHWGAGAVEATPIITSAFVGRTILSLAHAALHAAMDIVYGDDADHAFQPGAERGRGGGWHSPATVPTMLGQCGGPDTRPCIRAIHPPTATTDPLVIDLEASTQVLVCGSGDSTCALACALACRVFKLQVVSIDSALGASVELTLALRVVCLTYARTAVVCGARAAARAVHEPLGVADDTPSTVLPIFADGPTRVVSLGLHGGDVADLAVVLPVRLESRNTIDGTLLVVPVHTRAGTLPTGWADGSLPQRLVEAAAAGRDVSFDFDAVVMPLCNIKATAHQPGLEGMTHPQWLSTDGPDAVIEHAVAHAHIDLVFPTFENEEPFLPAMRQSTLVPVAACPLALILVAGGQVVATVMGSPLVLGRSGHGDSRGASVNLPAAVTPWGRS